LDLQLNNKVVLVTGSSKGIGFNIAKMLHTEGCHVVLNARNADELDKSVAKLPGTIRIVADVTKSDQANHLVAKVLNIYGRLDGLICNVGNGRSVPPGEEYLEEWHRIFSLNLWSATNMVEAAGNALANRKGSVVCISSICGQEVVPGAPLTYSCAKAALNMYVRGISRSLGKKGVRINAIGPGNILFDDSVWAQKLKDDKAAVAEMLDREVPLGKLGSPSDIANLTAYLLSPISNFTTGAVWTVDGGQVHA
jgi:NAD(P)-dependent dehydrogenase (short-subunit alcohol dehydrogenase family)